MGLAGGIDRAALLRAMEAVALECVGAYCQQGGRVTCNGRSIFPETFSGANGLLPALVWGSARKLAQLGDKVSGAFRSPVFCSDPTAFCGYVLADMEVESPEGFGEMSASPALLALSDFLRHDVLRLDSTLEFDLTELVDLFRSWAASAGHEAGSEIVFSAELNGENKN